MGSKKIWCLLAGLALLAAAGPAGAAVNLLHEFAGGTTDGYNPYGSLALSGTTLYGTTRYGGDSDLGVLFSYDTSTSGYTLLHEFAAVDDRRTPTGLSPGAGTPAGLDERGGVRGGGQLAQLLQPPD
jgi:uncharacterized repeat protein (TIGR03803 family)